MHSQEMIYFIYNAWFLRSKYFPGYIFILVMY